MPPSNGLQNVNAELNLHLTSASVLAYPDREAVFYTNASATAIGGLWTQDYPASDAAPAGERVIQYISKQLTLTQQRYSTIEREL